MKNIWFSYPCYILRESSKTCRGLTISQDRLQIGMSSFFRLKLRLTAKSIKSKLFLILYSTATFCKISLIYIVLCKLYQLRKLQWALETLKQVKMSNCFNDHWIEVSIEVDCQLRNCVFIAKWFFDGKILI